MKHTKRMALVLAVVMLVALFVPAMQASAADPTPTKTYYVAAAGNDSKDGLSKANAVKTVKKAMDLINAATLAANDVIGIEIEGAVDYGTFTGAIFPASKTIIVKGGEINFGAAAAIDFGGDVIFKGTTLATTADKVALAAAKGNVVLDNVTFKDNTKWSLFADAHDYAAAYAGGKGGSLTFRNGTYDVNVVAVAGALAAKPAGDYSNITIELIAGEGAILKDTLYGLYKDSPAGTIRATVDTGSLDNTVGKFTGAADIKEAIWCPQNGRLEFVLKSGKVSGIAGTGSKAITFNRSVVMELSGGQTGTVNVIGNSDKAQVADVYGDVAIKVSGDAKVAGSLFGMGKADVVHGSVFFTIEGGTFTSAVSPCNGGAVQVDGDLVSKISNVTLGDTSDDDYYGKYNSGNISGSVYNIMENVKFQDRAYMCGNGTVGGNVVNYLKNCSVAEGGANIGFYGWGGNTAGSVLNGNLTNILIDCTFPVFYGIMAESALDTDKVPTGGQGTTIKGNIENILVNCNITGIPNADPTLATPGDFYAAEKLYTTVNEKTQQVYQKQYTFEGSLKSVLSNCTIAGTVYDKPHDPVSQPVGGATLSTNTIAAPAVPAYPAAPTISGGAAPSNPSVPSTADSSAVVFFSFLALSSVAAVVVLKKKVCA